MKYKYNPLLDCGLQQAISSISDLDTKDHNLLDNLAWSVAGHTIDTDVDFDGNNIDNMDTINFLGDGGVVEGMMTFAAGTKGIAVTASGINFSAFGECAFNDTKFLAYTGDPDDITSDALFVCIFGGTSTPIDATNHVAASYRSYVGAIPASGNAGSLQTIMYSEGMTNANSWAYGHISQINGDSADVATSKGYGYLTDYTTSSSMVAIAYGIDKAGGSNLFDWAMASLITPLHFQSGVADGAAAIAYKFDTLNTLATAGATLLSVRNNTSEKFSIDKDGLVKLYGNLNCNDNEILNTKSIYPPQLAHGGF